MNETGEKTLPGEDKDYIYIKKAGPKADSSSSTTKEKVNITVMTTTTTTNFLRQLPILHYHARS